jgi:hypothetical protein
MFTTNEQIESLEISIKALKNASMMSKPKLAETCVTEAMVCIKKIAQTQAQQTKALVDLNKRLNEHVKTGK